MPEVLTYFVKTVFTVLYGVFYVVCVGILTTKSYSTYIYPSHHKCHYFTKFRPHCAQFSFDLISTKNFVLTQLHSRWQWSITLDSWSLFLNIYYCIALTPHQSHHIAPLFVVACGCLCTSQNNSNECSLDSCVYAMVLYQWAQWHIIDTVLLFRRDCLNNKSAPWKKNLVSAFRMKK